MLRTSLVALLAVVFCLACLSAYGANELTKEKAVAALQRAVEFFRTQVSSNGGYLWRYTGDLAYGEGEGKANKTTVWVQPPGTPSVGLAYLNAFELTGEEFCLEAARETAQALVRGQLRSGGWAYQIYWAPEERTKFDYRVDPEGSGKSNVSTIDDNTTQCALMFLMRVDQALKFEDDAIHEAALYGLDRLLAVQYPNGAWAQRFNKPPDPEKYPVKKASYPETWSRVFEGKDYHTHYTFNDNAIADVVSTLFDAADIYKDERYRAAAVKAGDFTLLAQMPEPQPGWAQQYDADMHPAWARKFEPPAITGGEARSAMEILLQVYLETGDTKYLEPFPRAIEYYRKSELPGGKLARFYELQTNKPLYFTKEYQLTYSSNDMPTHYSFIGDSWVSDIEARYQKVMKTDLAKWNASKNKKKTPKMTLELTQKAAVIVGAMDDRGAWVEDGRMRYYGDNDPTTRVIDCQTFIDNVTTLSQFISCFAVKEISGPVELPGETEEMQLGSESPWLVNEAGGGEMHNHALYIQNRKEGNRKLILEYDRHVTALLSPSSRILAITDYAGSDESDCRLFFLGDKIEKRDLRESIKKSSLAHFLAPANHHNYIEALKWNGDDELQIHLWGYGETPGGFDFNATYRISDDSIHVEEDS